jgi:hypothetical protein
LFWEGGLILKNKYKHQKDGTTLITVKYGETEVREVIIDTKNFKKVSAFKGTWGIWNRKNSDKVEIGTYTANRTKVFMHRIIMDTPKGLSTFNLSGNSYDLRESNLRVGNNGDQNKREHIKKTDNSTSNPLPNKKESPALRQLNISKLNNAREMKCYEMIIDNRTIVLSEEDMDVIFALKQN